MQYVSCNLINCCVRLLLQAGVQPTLDPSAETLRRSNALAQERRGFGWCMRVNA